MLREAIKMLVGSVVIYIVMAACSAQEGGGTGGGAGNSGTSGGASGVGGSGTLADAAGGRGGSGALPDVAAGAGGAAGVDRADVAVGGADGGGVDERPGVIDVLLDPVRDADAQTSGTRLKAKYIVTGDGARQFQGWYDSTRKEDCLFSTASDGKMRCLSGLASGASIFFTDAGCSQPIAALPPAADAGCPGPTYKSASLYQLGGCPAVAQYRTFSVGAAVATPSMVFQKSATGCTNIGSPSGYSWYSALEIAPTEFVEGAVQIDP